MAKQILTKISVAILFLLLTACAQHTVNLQPATEFTPLQKSAAVYIALPADASFESKLYHKSGAMVVVELERALEPYTNSVFHGTTVESKEQAFASANSKMCRYLFIPKIPHWEDRATEWSGKLDRLQLSITVTDMQTQAQISNAVIDANSTWFTFGGDHPEDMLAEPIGEFVNDLYGGN